MENILAKIVAHKRTEVADRKELYPIKLLEKSTFFSGQPVSMTQYLRREDKAGIIAEFKRKSPSKGIINHSATVEKTSIGYMQAGASGLSILTDTPFFGGKNEDLEVARKFNFCPILRKDFIMDEYQVVEAKSIGADCILLIASILTKEEVQSLTKCAKQLGMEVLMEVHNAQELDRISPDLDLVGVNNRNLETFETSLETSLKLADQIPSEFLKVSESGINTPEDIAQLRGAGFEGFLIGERFMKTASPERSCREFIAALNG